MNENDEQFSLCAARVFSKKRVDPSDRNCARQEPALLAAEFVHRHERKVEKDPPSHPGLASKMYASLFGMLSRLHSRRLHQWVSLPQANSLPAIAAICISDFAKIRECRAGRCAGVRVIAMRYEGRRAVWRRVDDRENLRSRKQSPDAIDRPLKR